MTKRDHEIEADEGRLQAEIETGRGNIVIRLYESEAPEAVRQFLRLVPICEGWGFHRVSPNFMIQAGPLTGLQSFEGKLLRNEFPKRLKFDHPGVVAMADASGSQWFITEVALPHLYGKHTIFGEVDKGFEIVPKIARVPVDRDGRATEPVIIHRITLDRVKRSAE